MAVLDLGLDLDLHHGGRDHRDRQLHDGLPMIGMILTLALLVIAGIIMAGYDSCLGRYDAIELVPTPRPSGPPISGWARP